MKKLNVKKATDILIPIVLFLTAFLWKFINAGERDICIDEPFTIFHAQESLRNILLLPAQNEPHPPLFMAILHFWIKLFGIGPFAMRSVPILFNALTPVFLYLTGKKIFGFCPGIIASGLFIFSTYHFYFGADTRAYSMLSMATASSLYFFLCTIREPSKKMNIIFLITSNIILIYSHYFGWFVVGMQGLTSVLYLKNRKVFVKIWLGLIITAILYTPMFVVLVKQFLISRKGTWVQPPAKTEFMNQIRWFLNSYIGLRAVIYTLVVGIIVSIISKISIKNWKELLISLIWWLIPFSFMFLISSKIPMFTDRYILFNSIGFYVFIGAVTGILYSKTKYLLFLSSMVILTAVSLRMYTGDFALRKIKASAEFLKSRTKENCIVLIHPQWANLGLMYYYRPDIFQDVNNYETLLSKNKIYPVWTIVDAKKTIEISQSPRVLYFQDNSISIDPSNAIFNHLDSMYTRTDSVPFP